MCCFLVLYPSHLLTPSYPPSLKVREASGAVVDVASLIAKASEVSRLCRTVDPVDDPPVRTEDSSTRLRRVVDELLTTEVAYVAGLRHTLDRFLAPLTDEQFLSR